MFEGVQPILTAAATVSGMYVALNGLRAWKRELTGKRDIELCQTVIESFYEAEARIAEMRSPFSYPEVESAERPKAAAESDAEKRLRDTTWVPMARFLNSREFWKEFFARKFRMRALFGEKAAKAYDRVDEILRKFRAAAQTRYHSVQGDQLVLEHGLNAQLERVIWAVTPDDALATEMKQAIRQMEDICVPIVRAKSGTWWWPAGWRKK